MGGNGGRSELHLLRGRCAGGAGSGYADSVTIGDVPVVVTGIPVDTTYTSRAFPMHGSPDGEAVWFTGSGVTLCYVGKEWFLFRKGSGLPPTGGTSVAVDDAGYVWISTADNGLYRSDAPFTPDFLRNALAGSSDREILRHTFSPVWTTASGAPTNSVRSLLGVPGHLWAGTSAGLVVLQTSPIRPVATLLHQRLGGGMVIGMTLTPHRQRLDQPERRPRGRRSAHLRRGRARFQGGRLDRRRSVGLWTVGRGRGRWVHFATPSGLSFRSFAARAESGASSRPAAAHRLSRDPHRERDCA